jgi:hypothetical protein
MLTLPNEIEQFAEASDTVQWLADAANEHIGTTDDAVQMIALLTLARSYLLEYATHRHRGMTVESALAATVKGELSISEQMDKYRQGLN